MTVGKNGKLVLAVRSSHGLEVPLSDPGSGKLLVDKNYVVFLTKLANDKLAENLKRIHLFEDRCGKYVWSDKTSTSANERDIVPQEFSSSTDVDECIGPNEAIEPILDHVAAQEHRNHYQL